MDCFDFLAVQGTLKTLVQDQFESIKSLAISENVMREIDNRSSDTCNKDEVDDQRAPSLHRVVVESFSTS